MFFLERMRGGRGEDQPLEGHEPCEYGPLNSTENSDHGDGALLNYKRRYDFEVTRQAPLDGA